MSAEEKSAAPLPKPKGWVLAKPGSQGINRVKAFGRTFEITNARLKDPKFLEQLAVIEKDAKIRLFDVVIVRG